MGMKKKFIRDSVYGDIRLNEIEVEVMDNPQFQRLRRIKQLGLISLIYPGANHTRFEHSIGTMHIASKLADKLDLNQDDKELVRISALLHDIGHGPFSHVSEGVLSFPHEELTKYVIKNTAIRDIVEKKFDINKIIEIINGEGKFGPIVSGELDADRMDYLLRDSHYTGVAYGIIDYERIISNINLNKHLSLDIKGVQAAEGALVSRYFMYPSVYQHHTTRIVNSMFRRGLKKLIDSGVINENDMYKYDDADIIGIFRNSEGYPKEIMERLDNRNIFKRVKTIRLDNFKTPEKLYKIKNKELRKAEEEIAMDYDIDKDYVILNIAEYPRFDEMKTEVSVDGKLYPLTEISNIIAALSKARFNIPDISLYVPEEEKSKFKKFKMEHYLDLPEIDKEKYHSIHYDQLKLF
ncbi:deoxyguanosinetriphosphate triphosphohydrolase-like protein [Methanobrevibacter woesei]|uniref:Deoxyguanosinetriphosphate triphosphohydrolase-like protein n=1 Tax=Methanobrevibacter woesei TaxID=190976 RepID=A0A2U1S7Y0_9EURY|nr:HD domain-containing protein [Methanobrevibacter woesei]PWB86159.1 deoxyguanosinetriphosphate triphosphohydrolase-like protein [Methanobrevibacter woesei]